MPTIQFINNSPQPGRKELAKLGGGGKSLLGLLAHLPEQGWNTHVVVPGEGQFTEELEKSGVQHNIFPFQPIDPHHPITAFKTFMQWRRLIKKASPDLIHANGFDLSRSFSYAAASLGIPYITHVRFPATPEGMRWTLRGFPKPAAFIFNSHAMMKDQWPTISELAPKSRPFVAHNAVDLEQFNPAPWPETPTLRIGIIANFAPFKRHEDFIQMAAEMLKTRQDLEFWIIGEDTQGIGRRKLLENMTHDLGISSYIKFLGHRSDIPDLIRQLHLVVVPSQFEPFGRVVIEAMACGRPVIGSNDGGIPEIIEHGKTGYLIEVGDWRDFSQHALSLLEKKEKWQQMSKAANKSANKNFSINAHIEKIISIYLNVIDNKQS